MFRAIDQYPRTIRAIADRATGQPEVDLRPVIDGLGLKVRNQGSRGTCSVFAITFVLEFMYGTRFGLGEDLSEEYTNHVANLVEGEFVDGDFFSAIDDGYQTWGVAREADVPYQPTQLTTVDQAQLAAGAQWARFRADFIKPWDATVGASQTQLDQVTAELDQQRPVCFGGWWPNSTLFGTEVVKGVEVMTVAPVDRKGDGMFDGHSVALVGYRRDADYAGGGYFVFRNSWGSGWGDDGYGYMPFSYVRAYANDLLAYRMHPVTARPGAPVGVAADGDRIRAAVVDTDGWVRAAAWDQSVLGGRWRAWWPVLRGRSRGSAPVEVVARTSDRLDLFVTGTNGTAYTAASIGSHARWRGWWEVAGGQVPAGGAVTAVARGPEQLDVFVVGTDGGVWTAAWKKGVGDDKWRGWWRIGDLAAKPGSRVTAVSRTPDRLDVFVAGSDGRVHTAAWRHGVADGKWRGWWEVAGRQVPAGGVVSAVARGPEQLDVFVVGTDGGVWTAAWKKGVGDDKWRGWWRIGDLAAKPGSRVTAVSRTPDRLDVFVAGSDGRVHTAAWRHGVADGKWRGWWEVAGGQVPAGGVVSAVARGPEQLDVFVVGTDGGVWTAAWKKGVGDNKWRGWWRVG